MYCLEVPLRAENGDVESALMMSFLYEGLHLKRFEVFLDEDADFDFAMVKVCGKYVMVVFGLVVVLFSSLLN